MDLTKRAASISNLPNLKQLRETCILQQFPFAPPIMRYILMNPLSPEVYQKLIQCCKIFFVKNPILVFNSLVYHFQRWKYCSQCCKRPSCGHRQFIDLDNVKNKIWLTGTFTFIYPDISKFSSTTFFSRIFRYDVEFLSLKHHSLSNEELKLFLTGVEECSLDHCIIKYKTGENVPLEEIIKFTSGCKSFWFRPHSANVTVKIFSELADACQEIKEICFYEMPHDFDVLVFYQYLKKNKNRTQIYIGLHLLIHHPVADVDAVVDEILKTDSFDFVPPVIGNTVFTNYEKMIQIQETEASKYS